jgi:hypothetical protein
MTYLKSYNTLRIPADTANNLHALLTIVSDHGDVGDDA